MAENFASKEGAGEKAAFNPALEFLKGVIGLINFSDHCFIERDYYGLFRTLKRIFMRVEHRFSVSERTEIENGFNSINTLMVKYPRLSGQEIGILTSTLEKINTSLLRGMNKYGMLIPSASDSRFAFAREWNGKYKWKGGYPKQHGKSST